MLLGVNAAPMHSSCALPQADLCGRNASSGLDSVAGQYLNAVDVQAVAPHPAALLASQLGLLKMRPQAVAVLQLRAVQALVDADRQLPASEPAAWSRNRNSGALRPQAAAVSMLIGISLIQGP